MYSLEEKTGTIHLEAGLYMLLLLVGVDRILFLLPIILFLCMCLLSVDLPFSQGSLMQLLKKGIAASFFLRLYISDDDLLLSFTKRL